jgi:O-antigen/teichoic acid export membrane protein
MNLNLIFTSFRSKISIFYFYKILSSFCVQALSFFLVYLLAPDEYGRLVLIITISQFMFVFTTGWTDPTIINLGTKKYSEKGNYKDIFYYRTLIVLFSLVIVTLIFFCNATWVLSFLRSQYKYSLLLVYLLYLAYSLQGFTYQLLYPSKKNNLQSIIELLINFALLVVALLFIRNVESYIYANVIAYFLYFVVIIRLFYYYFGKDDFSWSWTDFRATLEYSYWQISGVIGIYLINIGLNYIFSILKVDIAEIGLYNFAYKLFSGFTPIFSICVIIIPQWIFNKRKEKEKINIKNRLLCGILALSIMYLIAFVLLKPFLMLVNKNDYLQSVDYFIMLFPAFILMCYCQLMGLVTMTTQYYKYIQYATLIQGAVLLLSGYVFVLYLGVNGAICAVTLAFAVNAICLFLLYMKKVKSTLNILS